MDHLPSWGLFYAGAISVPLSVKLEESNDLLFRLRHAEVKALFVSKQQLPKIRRIRAELPELELIIVSVPFRSKRAKRPTEHSNDKDANISPTTRRSF